MISGARFGSFALIVGLLCASPGSAQTETSGNTPDKTAQTETPSTWTEPPTRGAAGPKAVEPPADNAAAPEAVKPPTDKPKQKAAAPERAAPDTEPKRQAAAPAPSAHRSAKLRREQIRVAARSRIVAEPQGQRPRYGRIARAHEGEATRAHRRTAERRTYAYRAYRPETPRTTRRFAAPYDSDDGAVSGYGTRRAGWGGLVSDDPERRLARARAAGYLVMRVRTYGYPDGTQVREMTPYTPYGME